MTTKYVKSENFIGWTSPDGRLKVIGVYKVDPKYNESIFKVTCEVCKQDTELFPEGYFIARKGNLLRGGNPCGCSNVKFITFYKGVHKDIYTLEQEIHRRLRGLGYEHLESSWSIETFKIECIPILRELIISCCTDLNIKTHYTQDEELNHKPDLHTYHWSEINEFISDMLK